MMRMIDEAFRIDAQKMGGAIQHQLTKSAERAPLIDKHVRAGVDKPGRFYRVPIFYGNERKSEVNVWKPTLHKQKTHLSRDDE